MSARGKTRRNDSFDHAICLVRPLLERLTELATELEGGQRPVALRPTAPSKGSKPRIGECTRPIDTGNWPRVEAALRNLDRVMEEEQVPRAPLSCDQCHKAIHEGWLYTFHAECFDERFEGEVDLNRLKSTVQRGFEPGHPVREFVLGLPDSMPSDQFREIALGLISLLGSCSK